MKILLTIWLGMSSISFGSALSDGYYDCGSGSTLSLKRTDVHPVKNNISDIVFYASLEFSDGSTSVLESILFLNGSLKGLMISDEDGRPVIGTASVFGNSPAGLRLTLLDGRSAACVRKYK